MARLQTESETPNTAALIPGVSAAESELREALRLEELERRTRSLRALPVAQSYRDPNATAESSEAGTGDAADADVALLENSEADILELFRNRPAEASSRAVEDYRQAKEAADRQRVLDYAMMDAAASLASTVESAQSSFDDLTANGNLS